MSKKTPSIKNDHIENTVMKKITEGKVSMKPRWYFIVGSVLMSAGMVGMSMLAIFLLNLSFFYLRSHGPNAEWRLQIMLETFPWYIPVLGLITVFAGLWMLKKYDFSYKHNFKMIAAGFIIIVIVAALLIDATGINDSWFGQGRRLRQNQKGGTAQQVQENTPRSESGIILDAQTINALHLALADERKALSTYNAVIEKFGEVKPFVNIVRAETQHISQLEGLFQTYQLEIPQDNSTAPTLPETLEEVCQIGVDAEIANDALYQELLASVQQEDIRTVFTSLARASLENHLPAFERCSK